MSLIRPMDSSMYHLPFTYAVWSYFTMLLRTFFILVGIAFEAILASTFINEIGL